jgi:hypothetical protein
MEKNFSEAITCYLKILFTSLRKPNSRVGCVKEDVAPSIKTNNNERHLNRQSSRGELKPMNKDEYS